MRGLFTSPCFIFAFIYLICIHPFVWCVLCSFRLFPCFLFIGLARKLLRNGVDLGFSGKLPADWTGFPDEVVENLKGTGF